ncbi:MAG: hypothetical protein K9M57_03075 [Phycisphaerae bacterium]|nr:hypothetical protein [Phycisphaerae bacterium]
MTVSITPFRFKSKFVAAMICLLPEVLYWGFYSGQNTEQDILRWAVLYSPWALAFFCSIIILGIVISIGHFVRYRPGVLSPIFALILTGTILLFHFSIGMDERDFQAEVFCNSPAQIKEFQLRSIEPLLKKELAIRIKKTPYLDSDLILEQIRKDWRWTFIESTNLVSPESLAKEEEVKIERRRIDAIGKGINKFIDGHKNDLRVADALYYKALLTDMKIDARALRDDDTLGFYYNIPIAHSEPIWQEILERFANHDVSIEARWRLAWLQPAYKKPDTGAFKFDAAKALLSEALEMCNKAIERRAKKASENQLKPSRLGRIFEPPPPSLSDDQLQELRIRIERMTILLASENRTTDAAQDARLVDFAKLDPHQLNYEDRIKEIQLKAPQSDPLQDNIELALALLIKDPVQKIKHLEEIIRQHPDKDGGLEAMLQLAPLLLEERARNDYVDEQEKLLLRSRQLLETVIKTRPDTFHARLAKKILAQNPIEKTE